MLDVAQSCPEFEVVGLLDANPERWGSQLRGVPILGDEALLPDLIAQGKVDAAYVGIGGVPSNQVRRTVFERLRASGVPLVTLQHARAVVACDAQVGEGCIIMAGALVNPAACLGTFVLVNTGAIVEHDCVLEDYVHICPGARLGGQVTVGEGAFVGLGATVLQGVRLGARCVVGAGAVVLRDVPADTVVVGNPARVLPARTPS